MNRRVLDDDSHVRRTLSFICFAQSGFPDLSKKQQKPWNFETVRTAFLEWVDKRDRKIIWISEQLDNIDPDVEQFVWYRINKNKYAGLMLLHAVVGFYKSRTAKAEDSTDTKKKLKRDKHGDLIIEILKSISEGTYPEQSVLDEINLTYYWNSEVMAYYGKVLELKNMPDAEFRVLPDQTDWLNR